MSKRRSASITHIPPTRPPCNPTFEYSVHTPPRTLLTDLPHIFPALKPPPNCTFNKNILLVPTIQHAAVDLLEFGPTQQNEKDRLLNVFLNWAKEMRTEILKRDAQSWCDITDPITGCAFFGPPGSGYSDVEGIRRMLAYATHDAGGCTILRHPQWGFAIYPATLFTTASVETVAAALEAVHMGVWAREVAGERQELPHAS